MCVCCVYVYMCDCWVIVQNMSHSHEKIKGYYEKTWIPWMSSLSLAVLCQITFTVQFSCSVVSSSLRPHEPQQARLPRQSATPGVHRNPSQLSWWCHPTISSSVVPFFSCPQSFDHQGLFQWVLCIRWPKYWSFSFNISPSMNTQDWFPLGWTGWISLQSKGLSRVFSNSTVQKHQFFGAQLSF